MADYNGWKNYETWALMLWINNEQGSQDFWREQAGIVWSEAVIAPDPYNIHSTASQTARSAFAEQLKMEHDENMPEAINTAVENTVYADLLSAALCEVDWYEVADALLTDADCEGYEPQERAGARA